MKQKVGIITFHCSYNYGSVLQAFALKEYIKQLGYETHIINYVYSKDFYQYKLFRPLMYVMRPQALLSDILFYRKNKKRNNNFRYFISKYLDMTPKEYKDTDDLTGLNRDFDIFICGSDQIWNLDCTDGVVPAYFLEFAEPNKVTIAYAPSLAHQHFKKDYSNELKRALTHIDYISIREESTLPLIQKLTKKSISVVLDPTLLVSRDVFQKILIEDYPKSGPYVFVYMLEYNAELVRYCNQISQNKKISIYYIANKKFSGILGTNVYGLAPNSFLSYIQHASYIITNSFHATVFSILFHKKFITFKTQTSSSRMVDLLSELNIKQCLYHQQISADINIHYNDVEKRLSKLRTYSIYYLQMALKRKRLDTNE